MAHFPDSRRMQIEYSWEDKWVAGVKLARKRTLIKPLLKFSHKYQVNLIDKTVTPQSSLQKLVFRTNKVSVIGM